MRSRLAALASISVTLQQASGFLPQLKVQQNDSDVLADCAATVAHCIVGTARTLPKPEVYLSIAKNLVRPLAPRQCTRLFFVLDLSSKADSQKGGSFKYSEEVLWQGAWRHLPPAGYWLDPPLPGPGAHSSFFEPWCLYQCVPMFDKNRLCLGLVTDFEAATGHRFDWVVRSRPDLKWLPQVIPGSLQQYSPAAAYAQFAWDAPMDTVLVLPRRFAAQMLQEILFGRCHTLQEAQEHQCKHWSCDCWIGIFAAEAGIPILPLKLRYDIVRLPTVADPKLPTLANDWWNAQLLHNRRLRTAILGPSGSDPMFSVGRSVELRASLAPLLPQAPPVCISYVEAGFCFAHAAQLLSVDFYLAAPIQNSWPEVRFNVWRPDKVSLGRLNATTLRLRASLPLRGGETSPQTLSVEPGPRSIVVRPPIALRAGDCLGWSVCGPVPFPFDDCQESGEEALMGVS
ncbi:unnamed protein product, partial [Polarella glacialis]